MDVPLILKNKVAAFDETWAKNLPPGRQNSPWPALRRNAAANAAKSLSKITPKTDDRAGWIEALLATLRHDASTLWNYRGTMCGTEICMRISITMFVLVNTLIQFSDDSVEEQIRLIAEQESAPEIMEFLNGETIR